MQSAIADLQARNGAARVLVNNAARDDRHDWRDVTPEYWDDRIAINIKHQFFASQAVAEDMGPTATLPYAGRVRMVFHGYQILGHVNIGEALGY